MIAIHPRENSFSDKWIEYCESNKIKYKLVNCYASNIIQEIKNCKILMWHWHHSDHKAILFARQLTYSLELMGMKVFPDINTSWHFDDKVGQKYLFEAIEAPFVNSYVFYDRLEALNWSKTIEYPKIFKLRRGAGADSVKMVKNKYHAKKLIDKAFSNGFKSKDRMNFLKERIWYFKRDRNIESFLNISKGLGRLFIPTSVEKNIPKEKNYIYFQDFIPNNDSDIRVIVIGKRAFGIKRMVRDGDFRASGSGNIVYDPDAIPLECIDIAFEVTKSMNSQTASYDFIFLNDKPLLIEASYGFSRKGYLPCPGYWDDSLIWHKGSFHPEYFMIEDILGSLK